MARLLCLKRTVQGSTSRHAHACKAQHRRGTNLGLCSPQRRAGDDAIRAIGEEHVVVCNVLEHLAVAASRTLRERTAAPTR